MLCILKKKKTKRKEKKIIYLVKTSEYKKIRKLFV